jgi:protein-disulfide isomerase
MQKHIDRGGQKMTVWFVVGFILVATIVTIIAAVTSAGDPGSGSNLSAPPVSVGEWTQGPQDAKVTLIEYGDFQCPACRTYYSMVKQLLAEYDDRVLFVSRNFPLYSIHPNGGISAQAAEAAGLQGKYWEMFDILYEKQAEWSRTATNRVVEQHFNGYAQSLGLDMAKFGRDINSDEVLRKIQADVNGAEAIGVNSTPSFYVNLQKIQNPSSYDQFKSIIDAAFTEA